MRLDELPWWPETGLQGTPMGGVPGCSGKLASLPGRYREEFVLAKILGAYLYGTSCVSQLLLLRPHLGLPRWLIGKEFAWNARDTGEAG